MSMIRLDLPQGGGVRGPATATPGGSIVVDVGPNDDSVTVTNASTGDRTDHDAAPGKGNVIPIPNVPGGTWFFIKVGKGLRARTIAVEVVSSSP